MTVETATYINQLDSSKPASGDARSEGDDHMRLLKSTLQATFPNITGAVTPTHTQLNNVFLGQASYVAGGGSADAYTASVNTTQITSYSDGLTLLVKSPATNTGASTINVNGLGVKTIVRNDGTALSAGDLVSGSIFSITYNSTTGKFHLASALAGTGVYLPLSAVAAAVQTWLATPSSANLAAAVSDETGSGALVFANSPTLITPALGTPASGTLTNCTGLPNAGLVNSSVTVNGTSISLGASGTVTAAAGTLTGTTLAGNVVNASLNAITPSGGTLAVTGAVSLTQNVIVAAGKGIDFSANSHAAGMTSELLSRYEEGTWTTNDSSGAGLSLTITGTSTYTRIGRQVLLITDVTFPATADTNLVLLGGLPFTTASGPAGAGSIGFTDYGAWITAAPQGSGTGIRLVGAAGFLTNANLSGKRIVICLACIV